MSTGHGLFLNPKDWPDKADTENTDHCSRQRGANDQFVILFVKKGYGQMSAFSVSFCTASTASCNTADFSQTSGRIPFFNKEDNQTYITSYESAYVSLNFSNADIAQVCTK